MLVWWGSEVECASALERIECDGALDPRDAARALDRLQRLSRIWHEIELSDLIRQAAVRFLWVHPLRAADALQLAAAEAAAEHRPASLDIVTLDDVSQSRPAERDFLSSMRSIYPGVKQSGRMHCPTTTDAVHEIILPVTIGALEIKTDLRAILLGPGDHRCCQESRAKSMV
jgi:uncharacterized protein